MILFLTDQVRATVEPESALPWRPRLFLRDLSVVLGPYDGPEAHEQHFLGTLGSGAWFWSEHDEARFSAGSGLLESLWLHVPPENTPEGMGRGRAWEQAERISGLPRLDDGAPFQLPPTDLRSLTAGSRSLIALADWAAEPPRQALRLAISEQMELLFADRVLCGWRLWDPARHLVSGWGYGPDTATPEGITALLGDYLELVTDSGAERFEEADPSAEEALLDLRDRAATAVGDPRGEVLLQTVDDLLEQFYGRPAGGR